MVTQAMILSSKCATLLRQTALAVPRTASSRAAKTSANKAQATAKPALTAVARPLLARLWAPCPLAFALLLSMVTTALKSTAKSSPAAALPAIPILLVSGAVMVLAEQTEPVLLTTHVLALLARPSLTEAPVRAHATAETVIAPLANAVPLALMQLIATARA